MKIFTTSLFLIVSVLFLGNIFYIDSILLIMGMFVAFFIFGKMFICYTMFEGHGVSNRKNIIGFPVGFVIYLSVIVYVLFLGISSSYDEHSTKMFYPDTLNNLRFFWLSASTAFIISILYWILFARQYFFHVSEYKIRMILTKKNCSKIFINSEVSRLRREGKIRD